MRAHNLDTPNPPFFFPFLIYSVLSSDAQKTPTYPLQIYWVTLLKIVSCALLQAAWRVPGQYLVMLRPGARESHVQRSVRRLRARAARRGHLLDVLQTYSGALHGFLVKMSSDVLDLVTASPAELISETCGGESNTNTNTYAFTQCDTQLAYKYSLWEFSCFFIFYFLSWLTAGVKRFLFFFLFNFLTLISKKESLASMQYKQINKTNILH